MILEAAVFAFIWPFIRKRRKEGAGGFTLVESILATSIVGFGLMGGMTVMANATINTVQMDLRSIAVQLAQEKMEMVLSDHYNDGYENVVSSYEKLKDGFAAFTRAVLVYEVSEEDLNTGKLGSGMKKVNVTVKWGKGDFVTLSTLVAEQ